MVSRAFKMVLLVGSVASLLAVGLVRIELVAWGQEKPPGFDGKPADAQKVTSAEATEFRLYDGFDGKLALDWEVIRPNPETASLTKNPGRLTIASEHGGLHAENYSGVSAKNVYMLPNPTKGDGDFVATICIEQFHPERPYQQAGPHIYDDDNNYINTVIACNEAGVLVSSAWESNGAFDGQNFYIPDLEWDRLWLRTTKRGKAYEAAYSTDGKTYTVFAEKVWGNGAPKMVGLAVMNGNGTTEPLDAAFDFFEVRSLTAEEKNDPVYLERQKLQGMWDVVSSQVDGEPLAESSGSRFVFSGMEVTFAMLGQSLKARYALDVSQDPKALRISRGYDGTVGTLAAIYRTDQDRLTLCMNLQPDRPAPTAIETKTGDGRLLVTLRRMPAAKAAAMERLTQFRPNYFRTCDMDRDGGLTLQEYLVGFPLPETATRGTELFNLLDGDRDGRLSLEEYKNPSRKAMFLEMDLDGDGAVNAEEYVNAQALTTPSTRAKRAFAGIDQEGNGQASFDEYSRNYPAVVFYRADANEDGQMSLGELASVYREWGSSNQAKAFEALDRDDSGSLRFEEYQAGTSILAFFIRDRNHDGELNWDEYCIWSKSPEALALAKQEFAKRDRNANERLTIEELLASLQTSEIRGAKTQVEAKDKQEQAATGKTTVKDGGK